MHCNKYFILIALMMGLLIGCEDDSRVPNDETADGDADADSDGDGDTDGDTDSDADSDGDADSDADSDSDKTCDVDLLFVIDNSASMSSYQEALGLAFPRFADSLVAALPGETNVHVGVTSTEMGFSSSGNGSAGPDGCTFEGEEGDETYYYITPDQTDTGRNGAQGRLYQPDGKEVFFSIDLNAPSSEFDELREWFTAASAIGEGGSNIEMLTAPAGWAVSDANSATNGAFFRDGGTVLVVFFMQDEPDQTPLEIDGGDGGEEMLERIVKAKSKCGGLECIVAGGFTDPDACGSEPRPIRAFLDGLTQPYVVDNLPSENLPSDQIADQMAEMLTTSLAQVILDTCNSIVIE